MIKVPYLRSFSTSAITVTATTAMTSAAAMAACGGAPTLIALSGLIGPPSITATEASTDQALELIRKRREEASGACSTGFTRSGGNCVPAGAASVPAQQFAAATPPPQAAAPPAAAAAPTTGPASAPVVQTKRAQASTPPAPAQAATAPQPTTIRSADAGYGGYSGGSLKDGSYDMPVSGTLRAHSVWAEGYYDHEKRENLAPGQANNQTRRSTSGGMISGFDVSNFSYGSVPSGFQIGAFSGYNSTRSKFTDVTLTGRGSDNASTQTTTFGQQRQEMDGAFLGAYGSVVHGAFSADLAVKVDLATVERRVFKHDVFSDDCAPPNITTVDTFTSNSTSLTNYVVASNANYRIPLSVGHYVEPTVGIRYSHTDFGGNAAALGFRDGDSFRVQGGLRVGTRFNTPDGWIWNTSLTGLLYSDVSINGYTITTTTPGLPPPVSAKIDEGKLRVMGVLENRVNVGYGYTLYNDLEIRAGDDYFGFGTRAGVRYQW